MSVPGDALRLGMVTVSSRDSKSMDETHIWDPGTETCVPDPEPTEGFVGRLTCLRLLSNQSLSGSTLPAGM